MSAPDLTDAGEDEFRAAFRDFVKSVDIGPPLGDSASRLSWRKAWSAAMFDVGFAGPSWPRKYGGMDLPFRLQVAHSEEVARARLPRTPGNGPTMAGPTIIKYGTAQQRERWLRPMLRGDEIWAQGFSEPGAGSDLQALRTSAVRDGDEYVVNGQKVWNSSADISDMAFVLVRTGTVESRQDGISYLLVDLHSPGVTVRPIKDLTGRSDFCEIFFDDTRVPVANRVGDENGGWAVTRTTLGHERIASAVTQTAFYGRIVDELVGLCNERGVASDDLACDRLAQALVEARVMRANAERTIGNVLANGDPGPASSISRLYNSEFEQRLHEVAVDLLGPAGLLQRDDPGTVEKGRWVFGFLRTRASTIGGGTAEIQRNTIAEQVLGLPRDPGMPRR